MITTMMAPGRFFLENKDNLHVSVYMYGQSETISKLTQILYAQELQTDMKSETTYAIVTCTWKFMKISTW